MMSNEEFDRKMEFFLNQQAQFDANIQQLQEGHKRLQEAHEATEKSVDRVVEATTRAAETTGMLAESLGRLTDFVHDGFKLTFETFRNTDVKINALVDAQIETEKRLRETDEMIRNLGTKFDRHLNEDHNGSKS